MKLNYILLLCVLFNTSCKKEAFEKTEATYEIISINDSIVKNDSIEAFILPYRTHLNTTLDSTLAYAPETYSKKDGELNTAIGNFMADVVLSEGNPIFKARTGKNIDGVLLNHGGIRSVISKGNISARTAFEVMPFENSVVVVSLKGKQINALFDYLSKAKRAHPVSKQVELLLDNDFNVKKFGHIKLLQTILDESSYSQMLKNKKDLENENRLENIKELLNAMKEFDNLESFLEHVALATSIDKNWEGQKVNLMTIHASKGLEFDVVFLPGWEEGLFPHQKSIEEKGEKGLEEERRLAYVGITRAKKLVNISFSMNRFYQGDWIDSIASRFIDELPNEHLEKNNFFAEDQNNDFEFNQDIEFKSEIKSPGWIRYQKRIKHK